MQRSEGSRPHASGTAVARWQGGRPLGAQRKDRSFVQSLQPHAGGGRHPPAFPRPAVPERRGQPGRRAGLSRPARPDPAPCGRGAGTGPVTLGASVPAFGPEDGARPGRHQRAQHRLAPLAALAGARAPLPCAPDLVRRARKGRQPVVRAGRGGQAHVLRRARGARLALRPQGEGRRNDGRPLRLPHLPAEHVFRNAPQVRNRNRLDLSTHLLHTHLAAVDLDLPAQILELDHAALEVHEQ